MKFVRNLFASRPMASILASLALMAASAPAHAGFDDALNNFAALGSSGVKVLIIFGIVGGLACLIYVGKLLMKKGGERGDDVEWGRIGFAMVAGGILLSLSYIGVSSVELMGGASADLGRQIVVP